LTLPARASLDAAGAADPLAGLRQGCLYLIESR
jgi:hypothetical protein